MKTKTLALGQMGTNCYLAWCPDTKEALVVDPGAEAEKILAEIEDLELKVKYIVNTHGHLDHIGANSALQQALHCPIAVGEDDATMLTDAQQNLSHQVGQPFTSPAAELLLNHGAKLEFGTCSLRVMATPGHTRGGIGLYGHATLFAGDTLFQGSIGRSDLPGGNQEQLLESIRTQFLTLPDETQVLPGHGPETTIGIERQSNPWLQG